MNHAGKHQKTPFYNKWWFWIILILAVIILVGALSDREEENTPDNLKEAEETEQQTDTKETDPKEENASEDTGDSKEPQIADEDGLTVEDTNEGPVVEDEIEDSQVSTERGNTNASLTRLNAGSFLVGTDIPAGRYVITGNGSGNLLIYDKDEMPYINEILGGGELGVESVTTDISKGDTIEISGIDEVTFTPAETVLYTDSLTTGIWYVGIDVVPGRYDISVTEGSGNLFVYDENDWPKVNEILGGEYGVTKVTVNLEEGYRVEIAGINKVNLNAR